MAQVELSLDPWALSTAGAAVEKAAGGEPPELPSGAPTIDDVELDRATGEIVVTWTPSDEGNVGRLYARLLADPSWGSPIASGTGQLSAFLPAPGIWEILVEEEKTEGYSGQPPSQTVRLYYIGAGVSPWEWLSAQIAALLRTDAALAETAGVSLADWAARVREGIDERQLPPRDGLPLPYLEYELASITDDPRTEESAEETVEVRFRGTLPTNQTGTPYTPYGLAYRFGRDIAAALRRGLGVPEDSFAFRRGAESKRGRFWICEWSGSFPLRVGRTGLD